MNSRDIIDEKLSFTLDILIKEMAKSHISLPIYLTSREYSIIDGVTYGNFSFDLQGSVDLEEIDIIYKVSQEYKLLHEYLDFTRKAEPFHTPVRGMIIRSTGIMKNELRICISDVYTDEIEDLITLLKIKGYHKDTHILQFEQWT